MLLKERFKKSYLKTKQLEETDFIKKLEKN